jgi:hypothetical protein
MAESCPSLRGWFFGTLGSAALSADNPLASNAKPGARHDYYERQKYLFAMAFVVVSIVPLLILNYNASRFYQDSWIDNTSREIATLAVERKEIIDRFLTTQENLLAGFLSLYTPLTLADDKKLASLFKAVNYGGEFTDLGVIDSKGNHLAYHGPFAEELAGKNLAATEWFTEAMKSGRFVGDVTSSHRREPHLTVAVANVGRSWILWSTIDLGKIHDLVKTAGVDASVLQFTGTARVFESQDAAVDGILGGRIVAGDVVVIRYEGPRGGPGMQEMLYPTSYLKSKGLGKACALITDGRFSGGTSGLSIGHCSPEAAEGGTIGLVETGDMIDIDIPNRTINLRVSDAVLAERRKAMEAKGKDAWKPVAPRKRKVSSALKAYALFASSAAKGAVRVLKD